MHCVTEIVESIDASHRDMNDLIMWYNCENIDSVDSTKALKVCGVIG